MKRLRLFTLEKENGEGDLAFSRRTTNAFDILQLEFCLMGTLVLTQDKEKSEFWLEIEEVNGD